MYRSKRDKLFIAALALLFITTFIMGWLLLQQAVLFFPLAMMVCLLMLAQVMYYLDIKRELGQPHKDYRQVEALFSMFSTLKLRHPLPPMRTWAISPDFANIVISLIAERRPGLVLEMGSGVSTLLAAYGLQEINEGVVVSLEHDEDFAAISAANVAKHGLQDIATVTYAPLEEVTIRGKSWLWYDVKQLEHLAPIDMLIIDGPPMATQRLARYPVLPLLFQRLSDDAVILLDDADRRDEKEIVKRWLREFDGFCLEKIATEKGAAILRLRRHI